MLCSVLKLCFAKDKYVWYFVNYSRCVEEHPKLSKWVNILYTRLFLAICFTSSFLLLSGCSSGTNKRLSNGDSNQPNISAIESQIKGSGGSAEPEKAGITWVSIPSGSYMMGCSLGDTKCESNEKPRHKETIKAFKMMSTEVTQGMYKEITGKSPSLYNNCGDNCPVEQVNWHDAKAFCTKVGGRLPTEAEWEYAARAGTDKARYGDIDSVAWYDSNSKRRPHPVGKKQANSWGLYDMLGNVWEWTEDCSSKNYVEQKNCSLRVLRGSCLNNDAWRVRVSLRGRYSPSHTISVIGFRCVRD